jgi:hypothetical protein
MLASFWGYCCDEAMDKKNGKSLAINTVSTMESLVSHFFNHDTSIYQQELNREGVMYYVGGVLFIMKLGLMVTSRWQ